MQGSTVDPAKTALNYHHPDKAAPEAAHEEHPDLRMFGVMVFLVSESMLFLGLFIAYLTFRAVAPTWPPTGTPELERLLPGINTIILLSSSLVIHRADTAIKKNDVSGMQLWFGLTALMGAIFLGGQLYEYSNLEFGLKSNLFASAFYLLTGFHGLHVFVGLIFMSAVLWRSRKSGFYSSTSHFGVEATELYWHFVDGVWVILFVLLYILR
ncbi:MAG TPA: heme-copper oxidase subunit III [Candidatus Caenarcaniphilales bacterium]